MGQSPVPKWKEPLGVDSGHSVLMAGCSHRSLDHKKALACGEHRRNDGQR